MKSSRFALGVLLLLAACGRTAAHDRDARSGVPAAVHASADTPDAHVGFAPAAHTVAPVAVHAALHHARAGETIAVPAGRHALGSTPGDPGRDPSVEADGIAIDVPAFDIDALPYPNDPALPAQLGATRTEAAGVCRARGRRLCTEIEWERACRGPEQTLFPQGDSWDSVHCAGAGDPGACASGFGVMLLGTRAAEWTSDAIDARAVIRGAGRDANAALHRCASRRTAEPTQGGLEVAFRCCGGEQPMLAYPREISRPPFREEPMGTAELARIVAQVPELARVRDGLTTFSPGAINEVLNHGATRAELHPELRFSVNPVRWSPTFGDELLVFTATSTVGSFVAALWVLPPTDGRTARYRHAASFVLAGDRVSMALGYGHATREEVQWSACWNCGGEHGVVHYDKDTAHVIAVQR